MKTRDQDKLVNIGRISSAVGLKGEVKVILYASDSENLKEGKVLLLKRGKEKLESAIASLRYQNGKPIIRLEGVDDRTAAESLKAMEISIRETDLEELPEGEHYVRDIVGYTVHDIAKNKDIGVLRDVLQNTAQNVLDVETADGGQILVPAVDAFMRGIDDENETINVELIDGFY